ncbi:WYL domain-containing protein [Rhizobium sp. TH2]|uniref:WYL domain-containing protein n=1 Tax=Rhizobium sp. TH2 TaxID=2775403 RepID=UPI0021579A02|nr:WYL domain-containing protein [Rhizobium sp. TH2]UVC09118.1 WYL domain-containing protein [Rhizobium sp. TH2]
MTETLSLTEPKTHIDLTLSEIDEPPFFDAIVEAIESRRVITLRYENDRLPRLFAPYFFRLAKNGNFVVIGMQIENPNSLDGAENQRRTFDVSKIASLKMTMELFVPVDTVKADDPSHATGIIASVLPWKYP